MAVINVLDKTVSEKIAAGEVIERPASVIKELAENAIDAGARHITVEIKNGGISYMRITDDGCGIDFDEIPTAFLRHATSKLKTGDDLNAIMTMGFRGEALASVCAVSRVEMLTRKAGEALGGSYKISGGEQTEHERCGCPEGTTIIIRDLFYNTPARLKFLKKDVSEAGYVGAVIDKLALANPGIAFRFIKDNKSIRATGGDGTLQSAVRAVYGRQTSQSFVPADYSYNGITVKGFVSSPLFCRASRGMQTFFVNSRYIKSTTCTAALEEGFRGSIMVGKFPACVLDITVPPETVDVNVHPAKTEVRFSSEKSVFDAVYLAVKNALLCCADEKRGIEIENRAPTAQGYDGKEDYFRKNTEKSTEIKQETLYTPTAAQTENYAPTAAYTQTAVQTAKPAAYTIPDGVPAVLTFNSPRAEYKISDDAAPHRDRNKMDFRITADENELPPRTDVSARENEGYRYITDVPAPAAGHGEPRKAPAAAADPPQIRVIGEFAATYIICEAEDELILIDKHAAHERINYERLKKEFTASSQLLMEKTEVRLSAEEYSALREYYEYVEKTGIELMFSDDFTVLITAVPSVITDCTPQELVCELARLLRHHAAEHGDGIFDDLLHTMACKSAIKANDKSDITELSALADRVMKDENIRFCPHGRPVMTALSKSRIEHFFGRS